MKYQNKKIRMQDYTLLFLTAILPRVAVCLFGRMGFWPSDEVATVSGAASLAGYDWSEVVSKAGYYGQGFYSLFAPLFRLTDNPFILYRTMAVVCAILQGSIAYLAYYCFSNYFHVSNRKLLLVMSVACSYMLNTEASILYNEHPYLLVSWLIALLLLKLNQNIDNRKKKAGLTVLLIAVLSYALTLHTRAWVLWLALAVVVFAYYYVYRKWLVSLPVCIVLGICMVGLVLVYISYTQHNIWLSENPEDLRNAGVTIDAAWTSITTLYAWLCILFGQLNSAVYASIGGAVIAGVMICHVLYCVFFKKKALPENAYGLEKKYFVLGVYFVAATIFTVGGLSLVWLNVVTEAMDAGYGGNAVAYKILFYFRYFAPYTGPLLMVLFSYLYHFTGTIRKYYRPATIILVGLQAFWFIFIVPYVYEYQGYKASRLSPYVFFLFGQKVNIVTFLAAAFFVFLAWFVMWKYLKKGKIGVFVTLITVFLIYHYFSMSICYVMPQQERRYEKINGGYEMVQKLEEKGIQLKELYAPSVVENTQCPYYYYQFYLNRYKIYPNYPTSDFENAVILYPKSGHKDMLTVGYTCFRLDNNECVYVMRPDLIQALEELGYKKKK